MSFQWKRGGNVALVAQRLVDMTALAESRECRIQVQQEAPYWVLVSYVGEDAQHYHDRISFVLLSDLLQPEYENIIRFAQWLDDMIAGRLFG